MGPANPAGQNRPLRPICESGVNDFTLFELRGVRKTRAFGPCMAKRKKGTGAKAMAAPVLEVIQQRFEQLAAHGYVEMRKGQWELTEKGLCCLIACAEPPMPKPLPPRYLTRHDIVDR